VSENPNSEQPSPWKRYMRFSSLGIELGLSVMIGLIGGQWLDKHFSTEPWLLLVGLLFGMAAGIRSMYSALKRLNAPQEREPPQTDQRPPQKS
jgi:ATP synthase protein I